MVRFDCLSDLRDPSNSSVKIRGISLSVIDVFTTIKRPEMALDYSRCSSETN